MNKRKKNTNQSKHPITGAFITQPISQADSRDPDSRVALPDDPNVSMNRDWSIENKKWKLSQKCSNRFDYKT